METYFSISETAKMAGMTSETLRHYDRIGLVKPGKTDAETGYRYYSSREIVRLNTIQALRYMDLSLKEIKRVLELDNLDEVVNFLKQAEKKADDKIARLEYAKAKIQLARADYEKKAGNEQEKGAQFVRQLSKRVIMLSESLQSPSLDVLWNYLSHFYDQIPDADRERYSFEDMAGIYTKGGEARLFAVCLRYPGREGLTVLPAGAYLCANCTEADREQVLAWLLDTAYQKYGVRAEFVVQQIVISGILQWNYQIQILLKEENRGGFAPD